MQAFPCLTPPAPSSKGNASGWSGTVPDVLRKSRSSPFFLSCKGLSGVMQQGRSSCPVSPPDAADVKADAPLGMSFPCSPRVAGREPRQDAAVALRSISLMCHDSPAELLTHGAVYGEMKPGDTKQEACPWSRAGLRGVLWVA